MSDEHISEDELNRYLDNELPPMQRAAMQLRLARDPAAAARLFAAARLTEVVRAAQPERLFPPRRSIAGAQKLERAFRWRQTYGRLRTSMAAAALVVLGWMAHAAMPLGFGGPLGAGMEEADETFILAAREALRVARLDAGPQRGSEPQVQKIERLVGAINISMPQLPATWQVTDVQVQPWNNRQSLVVTAQTPMLGQVTLVAVPMEDEQAIPPTTAADGRVPTVYWQSGGTAYALMGPAAPERLEKEAQGIEVATRRAVSPKVRG